MTRSCRLAILASHPIQYFTPIYRRLAAHPGLDIEVMYYRDFGVRPQFDRQFAREIQWDTDQLAGYRHRFLRNISPVSDTFNPLHAVNPGAFTQLLRGYDALWVNGYAYPSNWLAAIAAKLRGTKLLMRSDLRLYETEGHRWKKGARDLVIRAWVRACDALLYVGEANRRAYVHYGAAPEQLFFSPHSADTDHISAVSRSIGSDRRALRAKWGLPPEGIVVQFVGKLTARKHPERMLELANTLGPDVHISFAGTGPLEESLREETDRRRLRNVSFLGFVNQSKIAEVYAAGDIFVLPAEGEPWGLAVNEAMAAGTVPVVSSEVGAALDLITNGETGFVFPFGDWETMTRQVRTLAVDAAGRQRMADAARERVQYYSYDATVKGIIDCLATIGVCSTPSTMAPTRDLIDVRH